MNKQDFLKQYLSKEWYETSKRIKARDHNTCQMCGRNDVPLNVHHLYYGFDGNILSVPDESLITLCEDCHEAQKEYREEIYKIIESLRHNYTDFELFMLLHALDTILSYDGPAWIQKLYPLELLSDTVFGNTKMYKNITKWRERVYGEKIRNQAIVEYLMFGSNPRTSEYFLKTFGKTIEEYIEELKMDYPFIYSQLLQEANELIRK